MLEQIIDDVNRALDNEAYFAALTLALTLPDICGKAQYPEAAVGKRYINWYDEHIGKYEQCPCEHCKEVQMPYLSGEVIYSLRNSMLHQGTPNISKEVIRNTANKIDRFVLAIEKKKPFDIYSDSAGIVSSDFNDTTNREYRVNVRRLCSIICASAKGYYENNKGKFIFFNYSILDWDAEIARLETLKAWGMSDDRF